MHPTRFFHLASVIEAGTWAFLIGSILMKVFWQPEVGAVLVSWAGSAHGTAFLAYLFAVYSLARWAKWPWWAYVLGAACSAVPFATLLFDWFSRRRLWRTARGSHRAQRTAHWLLTHPVTFGCATAALFVFVLGNTLAG